MLLSSACTSNNFLLKINLLLLLLREKAKNLHRPASISPKLRIDSSPKFLCTARFSSGVAVYYELSKFVKNRDCKTE